MALTELFCSPILITHFTSDVLVPVDQITKRFTYPKPGDSLPEDFNYRLQDNFGGKLKFSLEERLPKEEIRTECMKAEEAEAEGTLRFDPDKRFNLNIYDDGPVEGYGSHRSQISSGRMEDTPYLEKMLACTAEATKILTPEKLRSFLERYKGKSVQLPPREGIDDNVYGSLKIYREEICELLSDWKRSNSETALDEVFDSLIKSEPDEECRNSLTTTMKEIMIWI